MNWLRSLLAHFGFAQKLIAVDTRRERKQRATIQKADRVIEDYRKLDGALRIVVKKR